MPAADDLAELRPLAGVRVETGADGSIVHVAEGGDPQLLWRPQPDDRARFEGRSAVKVRVGMTAVEGRLVEPCIHGDWGDGPSEATWKPLTLVERGVWSATAHSDAGSLRAIRFDPSIAPCRFVLTRFEVEPAGAATDRLPTLSPARSLARKLLRRSPAPITEAVRRLWGVAAGDPRRRRSAGRGLMRTLVPGRRDWWRQAWSDGFDVARRMRSPLFAAPPLHPPRRRPDGARVVAFYLPQYHPTPENDAWWGRGFTEWTNVAKAQPQFLGHRQPRAPADLGYYDLRLPEVRRAQADLANRTGVDAFCFHFYWFGGKRVLARPLDDFVADEEIDLPFALSWANENWTRRWDGQEHDVLLAQAHSPEDDVAVFDEMAGYMRSPRYLRSAGRCVLLVYRPDILPEPAATVERWRARARETGVGELFLLCSDAFGFADWRRDGFDGLVEFPPHAISVGEIGEAVAPLNPAFAGKVYDYAAVVDHKVTQLIEREDPRVFPGVMPAWDNEARKPGAGHVFHDATPDGFRRWTAAALDCTEALGAPEERFVFVNAWNEWAEGAYLEPDQWFGHGFAQGLRSAIEGRAAALTPEHPVVAQTQGRARRHNAVAIVHLFYPELIEPMGARLEALTDRVDVDVSFPETWTASEAARLAAAAPAARLTPVANAGRDVRPFLEALRRARAAGHTVFCKVHGKRSPHRAGGDEERERLLDALLAPEIVDRALERFAVEPRLGLLAPEETRHALGERSALHHNRVHLRRLAQALRFRFDDRTEFPAGTMFWGRTAAFGALADAPAQALDFEPEMGRIDGTLAHALERAMGAVAIAAGHDVRFDL